MARLLLLVALCLLVVAVVDAGRNKAARKAAKQAKRAKFGDLFCGNVCREQCESLRTCKTTTCPTKCASAVNKKLCKRDCLVNTCDKQTCTTCKTNCNAQKLICKVTSCVSECPASLGKKYLKNAACKRCMVANCS